MKAAATKSSSTSATSKRHPLSFPHPRPGTPGPFFSLLPLCVLRVLRDFSLRRASLCVPLRLLRALCDLPLRHARRAGTTETTGTTGTVRPPTHRPLPSVSLPPASTRRPLGGHPALCDRLVADVPRVQGQGEAWKLGSLEVWRLGLSCNARGAGSGTSGGRAAGAGGASPCRGSRGGAPFRFPFSPFVSFVIFPASCKPLCPSASPPCPL